VCANLRQAQRSVVLERRRAPGGEVFGLVVTIASNVNVNAKLCE
jgi:hypothetical protein